MKPTSVSSLDDAAPEAGANRRVFERIPATQLPQMSATLTTGPDIRLIDVSRGGALFECSKRLVPASAVALRLVTPDGTHIVRGRVVRSRIVRLERGGLGYQAAISFNEPLKDLIADDVATPSRGSAPVASAAAPAPAAPATETPSTDDFDLPIMTVTASVLHSSAELHEIFNGNDW